MRRANTVYSWLVAACMLVGVSVFGLAVSHAAADQVTERSVTLSSASVSADDVTYDVRFSAVGAAEAVVIDICENSPLVGQTCDLPAGFNASDAQVSTPGFTMYATSTSRVVIEGSIAAAEPIELVIDGIQNPNSAGTIYARVVTFDNATIAAASSPDHLGAGVVDQGSIAIAITPTIGVQGTVPETLSFCASHDVIEADCGGIEPVSIQLGSEVSPGVKALIPGQIHESSLYVQLSTNALNGAVVRLKSDATNCGGMMRQDAQNACDIKPALDGIDASADRGLFGIMTSLSTSAAGADATGELVPATGSIYSNDSFRMNFVEDNVRGVTSLYGDPLLDTAGAPVNNKNMKLTFGATAANDTPAGDYSVSVQIIAIGKF